jgi:peptide/nickel transport system permease protein
MSAAQPVQDIEAAIAGSGVVAPEPGVPLPRRPYPTANWLGLLVRRPGLVLSVLVVVFVLLWAFLPDVIAPFDPLRAVASDTLKGPSGTHLFGTDELGRDVFSRMVHGTALSLETTLVAVAIGLFFGSLIGLFAGYLGSITDGVLMRIVDVILSIPMLLLTMAIVTAIGFGSVQLSIGVGIGMIGSVARVMRSEVIRVRESTFVDAERSMGAGTVYIVLRHILPSAMGPVLVLAILDFSQAILAIAALSFLGFGAPPPAPEWGSLVAGGQPYLDSAWWMCTLPGLTIAVFVVCVNRIARALQERRTR